MQDEWPVVNMPDRGINSTGSERGQLDELLTLIIMLYDDSEVNGYVVGSANVFSSLPPQHDASVGSHRLHGK